MPQNGNFNTCSCRKSIAVIDISGWVGNNNVDNCTVFLDGNQTRINNLFMANTAKPMANGKNKPRIYNGKNWGTASLKKQVNDYKNALVNNKGSIEYGILDCCQPVPSSMPRVRCLQELSLMQLGKSTKGTVGFDIIYGTVNAIESGIAYSSKEVLFFNRIPYNMVNNKVKKWYTLFHL